MAVLFWFCIFGGLFIIWALLCLKPDYDICYAAMEYEGYAAMGCCGGAVGGDSSTEYLSETCIGCPYFVCLKEDE